MAENELNRDLLKQAGKWIVDAEFILFTAGAGLSAAAGVNYADTRLFVREFPAMLQYGFTAQYQVIGFNDWTPDLQWGYWAAHVDLVRFQWPESPIYKNLHQLAVHLDPENTFVMTSNVDAMFENNGFDSQRIYTPQGDYALLQCTTPCWQTVWPWKEQIKKIRAATDPATQRLTDTSLVPRCPNCGGTVFPNVRVDNSFVDKHFRNDARRLQRWLMEAEKGRGVVIEVGAGFNTPSVIRWPGEKIIESTADWNLIRINLTDEQVPETLGRQAIGLKGDATTIVESFQDIVTTLR